MKPAAGRKMRQIPPTVVMWAVGGQAAGFGHLRRCWTLAERLNAHGAKVRLVLPSTECATSLRNATLETEISAADQFMDEMTSHCGLGPATIVLDDPAFPLASMVRLMGVSPVVCIDDVGGRTLPVDVVVNGSAGAQRVGYSGILITRYLLGPDFILLRQEFTDPPPPRAPANPARRVLVMTGGGPSGSLARRIVRAVRAAIPGASIDVVVGPFGDESFAAEPDVTVHRNPQNVRALMLAADLAVSGAGQTAYELAATSTPTIGVLLAENQKLNQAELTAHGCLLGIGSPVDPGFDQRLEEALHELSETPGRRAEMGRLGRRLVDGRGTERVAAAVLELTASVTRTGSGI